MAVKSTGLLVVCILILLKLKELRVTNVSPVKMPPCSGSSNLAGWKLNVYPELWNVMRSIQNCLKKYDAGTTRGSKIFTTHCVMEYCTRFPKILQKSVRMKMVQKFIFTSFNQHSGVKLWLQCLDCMLSIKPIKSGNSFEITHSDFVHQMICVLRGKQLLSSEILLHWIPTALVRATQPHWWASLLQ